MAAAALPAATRATVGGRPRTLGCSCRWGGRARPGAEEKGDTGRAVPCRIPVTPNREMGPARE